MNPTEPPRPEPVSAPFKSDVDRSWPLAISLLIVWRATDKAHWRPKVAQRLAEIAAEGGPAAVEQAALGLTEIAGMYLEMYANRMNASPDEVLQHAVILGNAGYVRSDRGPCRRLSPGAGRPS